MFVFKAIYRQGIEPLRRAYQDYAQRSAEVAERDVVFQQWVEEKGRELRAINTDEQFSPEKKYILVTTAMDEVEKETARYLEEAASVTALEKKLQHLFLTFIDRCAADHPEMGKEALMDYLWETIKK